MKTTTENAQQIAMDTGKTKIGEMFPLGAIHMSRKLKQKNFYQLNPTQNFNSHKIFEIPNCQHEFHSLIAEHILF